MLFAAVPIAFVDLPEDEIKRLSLRARLRIFCGGVWHNISLGLLTIGLILVFPLFLRPFYHVNQGAFVASSSQVSW